MANFTVISDNFTVICHNFTVIDGNPTVVTLTFTFFSGCFIWIVLISTLL